jgi:putative serine protease PepD
VNQIIDGEEPTHARLAVQVSDVQGDALTQGAQLREVTDGGAADEAGLEEGDVITKVDDKVIDGSESLVATIRSHRPGDEVTLTYERDGDTRTATVTLGSDADASDS